jgi:hypothetical protein
MLAWSPVILVMLVTVPPVPSLRATAGLLLLLPAPVWRLARPVPFSPLVPVPLLPCLLLLHPPPTLPLSHLLLGCLLVLLRGPSVGRWAVVGRVEVRLGIFSSRLLLLMLLLLLLELLLLWLWWQLLLLLLHWLLLDWLGLQLLLLLWLSLGLLGLCSHCLQQCLQLELFFIHEDWDFSPFLRFIGYLVCDHGCHYYRLLSQLCLDHLAGDVLGLCYQWVSCVFRPRPVKGAQHPVRTGHLTRPAAEHCREALKANDFLVRLRTLRALQCACGCHHFDLVDTVEVDHLNDGQASLLCYGHPFIEIFSEWAQFAIGL